MTTPPCIALAWASPEIVILDIDRSKYRPIVVRDANSRKEIELALAAQDPRGLVPIVDSVGTFARIADLPVAGFIVTDTLLALGQVQGAMILDQEPGRTDPAIKRVRIEDIHAVLDGTVPSQPFSVPHTLVKVSTELAKKITLRELMAKVLKKSGEEIVTPEFVLKTCERIAGRIHKSTWVARVRKPAQAAGIDVQVLGELERFIEDSSVSEGLWKGFYALVESNKDIAEVEKAHDVRADDLYYLREILGSDPLGPDGYVTSPTKTKKRK